MVARYPSQEELPARAEPPIFVPETEVQIAQNRRFFADSEKKPSGISLLAQSRLVLGESHLFAFSVNRRETRKHVNPVLS